MSTFLQVALFLVSVLSALFVFWLILKDDYSDTHIFPLGLMMLLAGLVGFFAASWGIKQGSIGALVLVVIAGFLRAQGYKMRLHEVLEASVPSLYIFLLLFIPSSLVANKELVRNVTIEMLLVLVALALFLVFRRYYRNFPWYPSGRVGFASLASACLYFLLRTVVAIVAPSMIFLISGVLSIAVGVPLGVLCAVVLYLQSGRNPEIDFAGLMSLFKK